MKKLLNGLLALVMTLSMFAGINVNAANNERGTITLKGAVAGKTYEIYKIFDLTYTGTGDNKKVSYTIAEGWENFFAGSTGSAYIVDNNNAEKKLSPIKVGNAIKYINITEDNKADFAKAAQDYIAGKTSLAKGNIKATGTTVTFNNLDLGYYLVFPVSASGKADNYSTMVSLESTTPNAEVNMKAIYPSITKEVDDNNVEVGQVQTYTISGIVPDYTGCDSYSYVVKDTMTDGLTYNNDAVVYINGEQITDAVRNTVGNGFTMSIPVMKYAIGSEIKVVYTATVNKNAINVVSQNEAYLEYGREGTIETTPHVIVESTSTSIEVVKVDGNDRNTKLAGAKFALYKNVDGTKLYYQALGEDNSQITTGSSTKNSVTKVNWVNKEAATVLTSDENGNINFAGIEKSDIYYLEEIEAPDGFNRLVEDIHVTFEGNTSNVAAHEVVANYSGSTLPSTGSTGTKIFLAIGLTLAIGAYVVFITNKRMENYE